MRRRRNPRREAQLSVSFAANYTGSIRTKMVQLRVPLAASGDVRTLAAWFEVDMGPGDNEDES